MTNATVVRCACGRCNCEISLENAIKKNDQYYCCEACANGHIDNQGCKMTNCKCG